tara:strand:+ start:5121 stop:5813 length:693 start_codon:yes stop_codon:yes gene_type:complete
MAKDLPYFKFFVSEWTDGDITLESLEAQGLFINVCSYYWSNECDVKLSKLRKRFKGKDKLIDQLISVDILKIEDENVLISFLIEQRHERVNKSETNKRIALESWEKRRESERNANASETQSERVTIKKRREEKKEDKEFNLFWSKYPKNIAKPKCLQKWNKLKQEDIDKILNTIDTFLEYKPFKDYTHPNPLTYLNNERWNDELSTIEEVKIIDPLVEYAKEQKRLYGYS